MEAISYLSNQVGKNKGLLIDFEALQNKRKSGESFEEILEEIEDILALELSKFEESQPYEEVRKYFKWTRLILELQKLKIVKC